MEGFQVLSENFWYGAKDFVDSLSEPHPPITPIKAYRIVDLQNQDISHTPPIRPPNKCLGRASLKPYRREDFNFLQKMVRHSNLS